MVDVVVNAICNNIMLGGNGETLVYLIWTRMYVYVIIRYMPSKRLGIRIEN